MGDQCQQCGVPRGADPSKSLTEHQIGPISDVMLLNPVNRGVALGYSRWAGGLVEQRRSSIQLGVLVAVAGLFGITFLSIFGCVAASTGSWLFLLFGLVLFGAMAAFVIKLILKTRKNGLVNQRFANEGGALISGEVTSSRIRYVGSTKHHNRRPRIGVEYRFQVPDGRVLTGQGMSRYAPPEGNVLPPPGTRVAVLYLDERHYKAL